MLSFSKDERVSPEIANNYALGIIQYYADEYQIVYAVHDNTDDVHIHFVMNQVSYKDGYKYGGKKKNYYNFKRYIERIIEHYVILDKKDGEIED